MAPIKFGHIPWKGSQSQEWPATQCLRAQTAILTDFRILLWPNQSFFHGSKLTLKKKNYLLKSEANNHKQDTVSFVIGINQTNSLQRLRTAVHHHPSSHDRVINLSILPATFHNIPLHRKTFAFERFSQLVCAHMLQIFP